MIVVRLVGGEPIRFPRCQGGVNESGMLGRRYLMTWAWAQVWEWDKVSQVEPG